MEQKKSNLTLALHAQTAAHTNYRQRDGDARTAAVTDANRIRDKIHRIAYVWYIAYI